MILETKHFGTSEAGNPSYGSNRTTCSATIKYVHATGFEYDRGTHHRTRHIVIVYSLTFYANPDLYSILYIFVTESLGRKIEIAFFLCILLYYIFLCIRNPFSLFIYLFYSCLWFLLSV